MVVLTVPDHRAACSRIYLLDLESPDQCSPLYASDHGPFFTLSHDTIIV